MLSTKDVKIGGDVPKTLQPGNAKAKIYSVELTTVPYKEGAYHLVMHLEGPDMGGDFKGFMIEKDNEALGSYQGQIGRVKADKWPFSDGKTKGGTVIHRDVSIVRFIKNLCAQGGWMEWCDAQDNKHETIEAFVKALNDEKPFKDKFLNWCLAAVEYQGKGGYTKHDLYLPRFSGTKVPLETPEAKPSQLIKYVESQHLERKESKAVPSFEPGDTTPPVDSDDDFKL